MKNQCLLLLDNKSENPTCEKCTIILIIYHNKSKGLWKMPGSTYAIPCIFYYMLGNRWRWKGAFRSFTESYILVLYVTSDLTVKCDSIKCTIGLAFTTMMQTNSVSYNSAAR